MFRLFAFLKGINVGGHIVRKEKLIEDFTSLGFNNVSTFKQSGNIIFETSLTDSKKITIMIEDKLKITLGYEVPTFLRTIAQLQNIINQEPFKDQKKEGTSFLVTFLEDTPNIQLQLPLTIPKSTAQIVSAKNMEVFSVTHGSGEGAIPNPFLESKLKMKATTRNINVIREIVEKYS